MKSIKIVTASMLLLGFSNLASAGPVSCATAAQWNGNSQLDYGNATGQETSACHTTDRWQKLGSDWNKETSSEALNTPDSASNDGVSWVTSNDGGVTWVQNGKLTSEGLVKFQFDVTRSTDGNHKYDLLESWIDWNQDGIWTEDETIISEKWWKNLNSDDTVTTSTANKNNDLSTWKNLGSGLASDTSKNITPNTWVDTSYNTPNNSSTNNNQGHWTNDIFNSTDTERRYTTEQMNIPIFATLEDIWLRARIVCENSLEHYTDNMNLLATGFQDQGEVEDYKLAIAKKPKPPVEVPEPSTLFIFAIGLIAFSIHRKKSK